MSIPASATIEVATFEFDGLGTITVGVENDAGTERVVIRYNGGRVRDITPAGGHVEDRTMASLPEDYQVSTA